jgi:hypothetical protein
MGNSKIWILEKNYFVLLLPLAHKWNGGIKGLAFATRNSEISNKSSCGTI